MPYITLKSLKVRWFVFRVSLVVVTVATTATACRTSSGSVEDVVSGAIPAQVHFTDVAAAVGLDFQHSAFHWGVSDDPLAMLGSGLCWLDYDRDGWLDLYAVNTYVAAEAGKWQANGGLPHSALYRNDHGRFADVSALTGTGLQVQGHGCLAADLDLDGWTDLYITTAGENVLLWNNGGVLFTLGGEAAGVNAPGWHNSAVVGDVNGDGWPDIFVAGYVDVGKPLPATTTDFPNNFAGQRDLLYLNQGLDTFGRATFREVGVEAGLEDNDFAPGLGALFTDMDGDGDPDLVVANGSAPNRLYENVAWPGGPTADPAGLGFRLVEIGHMLSLSETGSGVGLAGGDYDGDGRVDLAITGRAGQPQSLYTNVSDGDGIIFEETGDDLGERDISAGWSGWGISWADADLDTDLDLIVANGAFPVTDLPADGQPIRYFANLTAQGMTGLFQDLTNFAGFAGVDPLIARGSAVADYDNDGDLDLAINAIGGRLALLRNEGATGHWLAVNLDGSQPGDVAVMTAGAVVTAVLPGGRKLVCETHAGGSFLSSGNPGCHFGLGQDGTVELLQVRWPDGAVSTLENLTAGALVTVTRDEAIDPVTTIEEPVDTPAEIEDFLFALKLKAGGARLPEVLPAASPAMIRLGEALFWDRELSGNRDVACVTCHHPLAGTGDDLSLSIGVGGSGFAAGRQLGVDRELIPRNAPEIYNRGAAGWHTMFWDGRVTSTAEGGYGSPAGVNLPLGLDNIVAVQAMFPVTSRDEMRGRFGDLDVYGQVNELAMIDNSSFKAIWAAIMDRLLAIPGYQALFADAYPGVPAERLGFQHAANAIAAYEMSTFTRLDSPWDRYLGGETNALSLEAQRGAGLFYGRAGCSRCHNGGLLTDQRYHNVAVPQIGPGKGDEAPHDYGRGRETGAESDMFAFRTPPLRNVALTGPWMHNGAYTTLGAAVRHMLDPLSALAGYDLSQLDPALAESYGERPELLQTFDPLLEEPIDLSPAEMDDLLAFLLALTSPAALDGCRLIPGSVPSGLPIDQPLPGICD